MTSIYLIRHAENDFIGKRLVGWRPGVHLNELGHAQARALASSLKAIRFQAVYASPLERTVETATPIAEAQGLPVVTLPSLGEIKYGGWEGKTLKALRRRKLWKTVMFAPSLVRFPQGESFSEAQLRAVNQLEELRQMHPKPKDIIACVSHSDLIKLAVAHYLGLSLDLFQRLTISPASVSIISLHQGFARLLQLNDTSHSQPERGR